MKRTSRGYTSLAALMLASAFTAVVMVGLDARTADLGREADALCRLEARLASESAIAVAAASLARGTSAPTRGDGWTLELRGRTAIGRGEAVTARGRRCASTARVTFDERGVASSWENPTPERPL